MRGKQTAGGGAAGGPRRQVLVAASMDLAADVAAAVQARDVLEADGARAWMLGDLRRKGESDFDVQRRLLRHEHYIVIDRFADWGMPRKIGLMHLVDSGAGACLEVVRGDM